MGTEVQDSRDPEILLMLISAMTEVAAIIGVLILVGLSIFQILLILGMPLGEYAWGGQQKVLDTKLKIGSGISIILYIFMASMLLDKAGLVDFYSETIIRNYIYWVMVGYFGLGILMNSISKSKKEKRVMTPIVFVLFVISLVVGIGI